MPIAKVPSHSHFLAIWSLANSAQVYWRPKQCIATEETAVSDYNEASWCQTLTARGLQLNRCHMGTGLTLGGRRTINYIATAVVTTWTWKWCLCSEFKLLCLPSTTEFKILIFSLSKATTVGTTWIWKWCLGSSWDWMGYTQRLVEKKHKSLWRSSNDFFR